MAAPFIFRLETLLELRERTQSECAQRMAEVQRELGACERKIKALHGELVELIGGRRELRLQGHAPVDHFLQAEHYEVRLRRLLSVLEEQRQEIQLRADVRRLELVKASQAAKALQRLKERRRLQFEAEASRKETMAMDEVGQLMHQRRTRTA